MDLLDNCFLDESPRDNQESFDEEKVIDFVRVKMATDKARLFQTEKGDLWVPKSISRIEDHCIIVPDYFEPKYLKQSKSPFKNLEE